MLRNIVEPVEMGSADLKHLTLLQGTKAYGSHIEPMRIPAKERWPRHSHDNFYWAQEDWVAERSEEHTSELQSLMRISYAVFCLKKKKTNKRKYYHQQIYHEEKKQ